MNQLQEKTKLNEIIHTLIRSFSFAKPFAGLFFLSLLFNTLFSAFSAITITIIKPITELITKSNISNNIMPQGKGTILGNLKNTFFNTISSLIVNHANLKITIINLSLLIIILFIIKNIFKYYGFITGVRLEENIVKSIRDSLFKKLTSLSVDFFSKRKSGTLISVLTNDVMVLSSTTISALSGLLRDITQIILYLLLLIAISGYLTFIAFSTSIVSFIILKTAIKYLRRYAARMQSAMADYTSALQETVSGIRVVKAYNAEISANTRFMKETSKYVLSAVKYQKIITLIPSVNEIFAIMALCIVFFIGGLKVVNGEMRGDDLLLFLFSLFAIMSPLATIFFNLSQFQRGIIASERVFDVLDQKPTVNSGTEFIDSFKREIEVRNVSFTYSELPVINNASFVIGKTKKIALVGASGSGKSTMLDLLNRFYDPQEGEILIDGINIKNLDIKSYRKLFGIVSQETMLFNDTVANNILYGYEAPIESLIDATKIANAYDFVMKLPDGFDTIIGDRGVLLSGGERQRLAIARAIIRSPYILIFDEATSALDAESEKIVQDAIQKSLSDRTAVIVAHRLSTILECDEILVFDEGKIVERGTNHELLKLNGIYRKLYDLQFNKQINSLISPP